MEEAAEESVGGFCTRVGAKCGRWNPTPEQVKLLTDLFRSGLRTPSTDQIQNISAHLSSFGKIESKNVFYWFQNHKARERNHKKRRRPTPDQHPTPRPFLALDSKRSDACSRPYCMSVEEEMVISERRERAIETLELFPLSSYTMEAEKVMRTARNQHKGILPFFKTGRDIPPLDLRLSFM